MTYARGVITGALGTLVLLGIAVVVLWWAVTVPADEGDRDAGSPPPAERRPSVPAPERLGPDEVWLADLRLGATRLVTADSRLREVRAVGRGVRTGPDGLVADRVDVQATVPYDVVAEELGGGSTVRAADDGQAEIVRGVEVLGRELRVVARGTVEVAGGRLVVEPRSIDLGGPDFVSEGIAAAVRQLVTIEHEVEGLPRGLVLEDVAVRDDGFRARLSGSSVVLAP